MRICLISFFIFCITYFYLQLFLASLWPHYNGSLTRPRFAGAAAHLDPVMTENPERYSLLSYEFWMYCRAGSVNNISLRNTAVTSHTSITLYHLFCDQPKFSSKVGTTNIDQQFTTSGRVTHTHFTLLYIDFELKHFP